MPILDKIFGKAGNDLANSIGNVVDNLSTSDQEKLNAKNQLVDIVTGRLSELAEHQSSVIKAEINGNWLQRSWRPIMALWSMVIITICIFVDHNLNTVPGDFWLLLTISVGGYVGGRTLEKTVATSTKGIDIPFLKKKDRNV